MAATPHANRFEQDRQPLVWVAPVLIFSTAALLAWVIYRAVSSTLVGEFAAIRLGIWLQLFLLLFSGGMLTILALRLSPPLRMYLPAAWLGVFLFLVVALPLHSTSFPLDGIGGDQRLYSAYVAKFAATADNVDVIYPSLPAFYPPLYYYVLGRLSAWLSIAPYTMLKFGMLATAAALPLLLAFAWRPLLGGTLAAATIFVVLVDQNFYKPAEWVSMLLFLPWWLYFVLNLTERRFTMWRQRLLWLIGGGLLGALIFTTYYYWFFIGILTLIIGLLSPRWLGRSDDDRRSMLGDAVSMLLATALFSIFYWGPYLASMAASGGWEVLQSRWMTEGKIALPLPFAELSLTGAFLAAGLAYLVLTAEGNRISRSLLAFFVALYAWFGLGYLGMLTNHPLLTFRAYPMVTYVLALGACVGLAQLRRRHLAVMWQPQRAFARLSVAASIALCLFFGQQTISSYVNSKYVEDAVSSAVPLARLEAIDKLLPLAEPPPTLLSSLAYASLYAYRPYYGFIPWSAHYSHPAGLFQQRTDFLAGLAGTHDPYVFYEAFTGNRFGRIDGLLLEPAGDGWLLRYADDNFPDRTIDRSLYFASALLAEPCFRQSVEGELTLFQPAANCTADAAATDLAAVAARYSLGATFAPHLANPPTAIELSQLESQLLASDLSQVNENTLLDLIRASDGALAEHAQEELMSRLDQPLQLTLREPQGNGEVTVLGYRLEPGTAGMPPVLALYFEVVHPPAQDYASWLHAKQGEIQVNYDHQPLAPTSAWQPRSIYVDRTVLVDVPQEAALSFGFWHGETDTRLAQPNGDTWIDLPAIR